MFVSRQWAVVGGRGDVSSVLAILSNTKTAVLIIQQITSPIYIDDHEQLID